VDREAGNLPVDSVLATNAVGAAEGVRHLAAAGHRRIAYLGDRRTIPPRSSGSRATGGARRTGDPRCPALVVHDIRDAAGSDGAVTTLLSRAGPADGALHRPEHDHDRGRAGVAAPGAEHRVALVGFDDFLLAELLSPGVTVVAQDPAAMGRIAAELLFERIGGSTRPPRCGWWPRP
jgi:LacI family transcriptional regulator